MRRQPLLLHSYCHAARFETGCSGYILASVKDDKVLASNSINISATQSLVLNLDGCSANYMPRVICRLDPEMVHTVSNQHGG
jgi:hypothetical protein